jgi:hypothetical protein
MIFFTISSNELLSNICYMSWVCLPLWLLYESNNIWPAQSLLHLLLTKLRSNLVILNSCIHNIKTRKYFGVVNTSHRISLPDIFLQFSFIKCCRLLYLFLFIPFFLQLFIVSRLSKLGVCFVFLAKFSYSTSYPLYRENVVIFFFLRVWTFSFFS